MTEDQEQRGTVDVPRRRPFPVVDERLLSPPRRRMLRGYRDPDALMPLPPGCVYVFGRGGHFEQHAGSAHLSGYEKALVQADTMCIVDMRLRRVATYLTVHSTSAASDFVARVAFMVKVSSAAAVASKGIVDVRDVLEAQIRQDPALMDYHDKFAVEQLAVARTQILAYLTTTYQRNPLKVDGLSISIRDVYLYAPRAVREQAASVQNLMWAQCREKIEHAAERSRVDHVRGLFSSTFDAWVTAICRGDVTAGEIAKLMAEQDDKQGDRLHAQLQKLADSKMLDRMPRHQREIAEAAVAALVGRPVVHDRSKGTPASLTDRRPAAEDGGTSDSQDDEPGLYFPPDDDRGER